ncbi:hypothetical protein FRB97_006839 [Tulasnella sp. 331]|nr:hypothetical protein FRB97_006839 [Tulasnella sp. 331]
MTNSINPYTADQVLKGTDPSYGSASPVIAGFIRDLVDAKLGIENSLKELDLHIADDSNPADRISELVEAICYLLRGNRELDGETEDLAHSSWLSYVFTRPPNGT